MSLDVFSRSLLVSEAKEIDDRIAFILVRDGISREMLKAAVPVDFDAPYYEQKTTPVQLLIKTADFLGVSIEWLLTGKGRNTRTPKEPDSGAMVCRSAILRGNRARIINVNNYN